MENGVAIVDDSVMVENKIAEENEKVDVGVVGDSGEIKEPGDEFFEEAIETRENLQEDAEKSGLDDSGLVADAIRNVNTCDTGSEDVKENLNLEPEAETFEEAIEVPTEVGAQDNVIPTDDGTQEFVAQSVVEQKDKEQKYGESADDSVVSDKINEGGTETGAKADKMNGWKEVTKITGTGETEVLRDEKNGNLKSETVSEMPVKGDTDKVEEDVKLESKLEVLHQEAKAKGEGSRADAVATNYQDKNVPESADTSVSMIVDLQDDEFVEALDDKSVNVETRDQGKESGEVKCATVDLGSVRGGDDEKTNKAFASVEVEDNLNGDIKDSSYARDIKHNGEIDAVKDMPSELRKSADGVVDSAFGHVMR